MSEQRLIDVAIDELEFQRDINQQLGAENERLQAEIAAMRPIVEAVAKLDARETRENPIYTRDVVLHSDEINVLWIREQARALVVGCAATSAPGRLPGAEEA